MKILMFGWEFPPHISGGLGTACEGLTHALAQQQVELTFVVPKLFGNEDQSRFPILSASEIPFAVKDVSQKEDATEENTNSSGVPIQMDVLESDKTIPTSLSNAERQISQRKVKSTAASISLIEVQSTLMPYSHPGFSEARYTVDRWKEEWQNLIEKTIDNTPSSETGRVDSDSDAFVNNNQDDLNKIGCVLKEPIKVHKHTFSGTYGPDLMSETLRYAEVAKEIAVTQSFDLIHAHDWITFPSGIAAKRVSGKKLIVHVHATEVDRSGAHPHPVVFAIEKEGLTQADHVVAVSEWTRNILIKHYDVNADKISVVHNGVVSKPKEILTPGNKLGSHYITFLGRITFQKGPLYFVDAAVKVLEKFPDTHFIVAGSGDMLPQMIDRIAKLRISSHFHFTGFLSGNQINRVWSLTDLYVMPSVSEPFGITPLEASHSGVPVIVSKQSGVAEVMSHSIKVDFWNIDELANAMCGVLAYPALAKSLIENSREELQEITWEKAAAKLKILYERMSDGQVSNRVE